MAERDLMAELFAAADETTALLTKAGQKRKRAPGAGRPHEIADPSDPAVKVSIRLPRSQQAWLAAQEGGVSAALRELIEEAMNRAT